MPHITQSPLSSPSLRSIAHHAQVHAHGHGHGPIRASYFPPVPNAPHVYHPRVPPTPQSSLNIIHHSPQPNLGSSLVGCLKHTQHISSRPSPSATHGNVPPVGGGAAHGHGPTYGYGNESMSSGGGPYHTGDPLRPAMKSTNPQEKRRISTSVNINMNMNMGVGVGMGNLKISNIPLGPNANGSTSTPTRSMHTSATSHASVRNVIPAIKSVAPDATTTTGGAGKRRPSFKIELPPRPIAPSHHHQQMAGHTPGPSAGARQLVASPAIATQQYTMPQPISRATAGQQLPVFIDPFPNPTYSPPPVGGYVILRAPTRTQPQSNFFEDFPSPTHIAPGQMQMQMELEMEGLSGLGYSLNRLRAPTPWLRGKAAEKGLEEEDDEWIRAEEVESGLREVESRVRGLGVA
ncbi:hypothetical protein IAT40_006471 [Kwoniella sp. CBS 6097]